MRISQEGIEIIKRFEGCSLKKYRCPAGFLTIGYGHKIEYGEKISDTISLPKAQELLESDIFSTEIRLEKCLKGVEININQYSALVSFTFNIGIGNFSKSTLLKKLKQYDYNGASLELTRWVYANGKKLRGLIRRRESEKALFLKESIDI